MLLLVHLMRQIDKKTTAEFLPKKFILTASSKISLPTMRCSTQNDEYYEGSWLPWVKSRVHHTATNNSVSPKQHHKIEPSLLVCSPQCTIFVDVYSYNNILNKFYITWLQQSLPNCKATLLCIYKETAFGKQENKKKINKRIWESKLTLHYMKSSYSL